jgi:putative membrane protein
MKRMSMYAVAFAAAISLACGGGNGEPGRTGATEGPGVGAAGRPAGETRDAQEFVQRAVEKNYAEAQLGKMAQERASNPEVRQFAQMMVEDHSRALNDLRELARRENIQVNEQLNDEARRLQERLQGLKGAEFDREYMEAMVRSHEESQEMVENRADRTGQQADAGRSGYGGQAGGQQGDRQQVGTAGQQQGIDQGLNQWAAKTLPVIERHHQRAQEILERLENQGNQGGARR